MTADAMELVGWEFSSPAKERVLTDYPDGGHADLQAGFELPAMDQGKHLHAGTDPENRDRAGRQPGELPDVDEELVISEGCPAEHHGL